MTHTPKKMKQFKPQKFSGGRVFNANAKADALYKTSRWTNHREEFLKHNPKCYPCGGPASVVDHLVPHKGREEFFWKADNMIPMCEKCHNTITGLYDYKYKPGASIKDKLDWIAWRRAKHELTFKVKVVPVAAC